MKKLLKILLVMIMGLSLCACNNNEGETEGESETSSVIVKKVEEEETTVDENEEEIYDNRDVEAVVEKMLTLPISSTMTIENYAKEDDNCFWILNYNDTSTFALGCNPDSNGKIIFALKPSSLDDDTGSDDWLYMMTFLTMAVDTSFSEYGAYAFIINFINNREDEPSKTKNGVLYYFEESSYIFSITY
ncbi:MAG: hypothetical protein LUG60_10335 [Erysipelotrichaceae bacterium]|nr:hypothetical protein [Erysipelotrichaceae bacterium]